MATRPSPTKTRHAARDIGTHIKTWRLMTNMTAEQVCISAAISRPTLRRLENGDLGVSMETYLNVLRVLGVLNSVVKAHDPYDTDFGRARADDALPKRVRRRANPPVRPV